MRHRARNVLPAEHFHPQPLRIDLDCFPVDCRSARCPAEMLGYRVPVQIAAEANCTEMYSLAPARKIDPSTSSHTATGMTRIETVPSEFKSKRRTSSSTLPSAVYGGCPVLAPPRLCLRTPELLLGVGWYVNDIYCSSQPETSIHLNKMCCMVRKTVFLAKHLLLDGFAQVRRLQRADRVQVHIGANQMS